MSHAVHVSSPVYTSVTVLEENSLARCFRGTATSPVAGTNAFDPSDAIRGLAVPFAMQNALRRNYPIVAEEPETAER